MPETYEIEVDGQSFEVEADSIEDASQAAGTFAGEGRQLQGFERALAGAETIGAAPWYAKPFLGGGSVLEKLEGLPAVGGFVGGLLGASGGPVTAVGGATLGGATGASLRQLIRRGIGASAPETSLEAGLDIGKRGAVEGVAEGLGLGFARGVRAFASPGRAGLDAGVTAAAKRQGVELPASALTRSRPVAYAEAVAAEGFGGGKVSSKFSGAQMHLTALADQTVARASNLTNDIQRGEAIARGFTAFKKAWVKRKNALYQEIDRELPGLGMKAEKTVSLLEDVVSNQEGAARILQGGPAKDKSFFRGLLEGLTETVQRPGKTRPARTLLGASTVENVPQDVRVLRNLSIKDLREAIREIDQKVSASYAEPFAAANKGLLQKLSATLDDDFMRALNEQAPDTAMNLQLANRAYSRGIEKINATFGKSIFKLAKERRYDLIAKAIANPRMSVMDVPRIMDVAGVEGTEAIRVSVLADVVGRAKGANKLLTPQGLDRAMKEYGKDRLEALLTRKQMSKLQDLATLSGSLERGQKILSGSPTAGKARWMAYGSAVTGAVVGHPAALTYILGDVAFNKFIGTKIGQRWLTTGFPLAGAALGAAAKQAPRAGATAHQMTNAEE